MVESTGLKDILKLFEANTPLAVLAVKAPVGFVTGALIDTYDVSQLIEACSVQPAEGCASSGRWTSVVQLRENSWTTVLWAAGCVAPETQAGLGMFAQDLSTTLGTEAVALLIAVPGVWGRDDVIQGSTSGFSFYEEGELVERAVFSADGKALSFESTQRETLEPGETDLEILNRFLAERGLYLPPCVPDSSGEHGCSAVGLLEPGRVARVDLIEGDLRLAIEEETLDMVLEESSGEPGAGLPEVRVATADQESQAASSGDPEAQDGSDSGSDELDCPADVEQDASSGLLGRLGGWVSRLFK